MQNPQKHKLAAILLAAGPSSRLGRPKQLLEFNGETLVRRAARLLLELGLKVIAVTGAESVKVEKSLKGLALDTVYNENWVQGMGESIARGASKIPAGYDGVLIMQCDQWRIQKDDLFSLISSWNSDISRIYATSWCSKESLVYGPPVIFPSDLIHELKNVKGQMGAKALLDQYSGRLELVGMANAASDLDTTEDLKRLLNQSVRCPNS